MAAWLLLCAMVATSALVYHLSAPPAAAPPGQRTPIRRVPSGAVLAAALPARQPNVRVTMRPAAGPIVGAGPRAGSLPDSPPVPHPPTRTDTVPPLQPANLVDTTGRQVAISAQLIEQRAADWATVAAGYLPGTAMTPPRHRAAVAVTPARIGTPSATPRIVYLVVTATPKPSIQYQQAGLRSALQPTATDQPIATAQPTPVPPTDTPSLGNTQQVWITGYIDQGLTATGMQAGPGICAVDPSYIAMGTRIVIDGIGSCLAEDTGAAVIGPHVDVWVPTDAEANAITGWHTASW